MWASMMLLLLAFVHIKQIGNLIVAVQELGFIIHRLFGEDSSAEGIFSKYSIDRHLISEELIFFHAWHK
jgi:protein-arginine kinase